MTGTEIIFIIKARMPVWRSILNYVGKTRRGVCCLSSAVEQTHMECRIYTWEPRLEGYVDKLRHIERYIAMVKKRNLSNWDIFSTEI